MNFKRTIIILLAVAVFVAVVLYFNKTESINNENIDMKLVKKLVSLKCKDDNCFDKNLYDNCLLNKNDTNTSCANRMIYHSPYYKKLRHEKAIQRRKENDKKRKYITIKCLAENEEDCKYLDGRIKLWACIYGNSKIRNCRPTYSEISYGQQCEIIEENNDYEIDEVKLNCDGHVGWITSEYYIDYNNICIGKQNCTY